MAKRPSLRSNVQAPDRRSAALAAVEKMAPASEPKPEPAARSLDDKMHPNGKRPLTATITIDRPTLELLEDVAMARKRRTGEGRASVSAVVRDLIELHRAELEAELKRP